MGCWNGTCMLTHLPIIAGDPVVAFLIEVTPAAASGSAPCYSNDRGAPLTTPIKAKYNDYGSIEDIEPHSEVLAMSFLNIDNLKTATAGDEADDGEEAINFASLESICSNGAERGKLRVGSIFSQTPSEAGLALIHRGAFEALVAASAAQKDYKGVASRDRVERELDEALAKWLAREAKRAKIESQGDAKKVKEELDDLRFEEMSEEMNGRQKLFASMNGGHVAYSSRLTQNSAALSAAMDPESRAALVEMRLFCEGLSSGRMDWQVSPGAGSQDGDFDIQIAVAEAARAIVAPRLAEREEQRLWDEQYEREQAAKAAKAAAPKKKA